jgi:hypothetical protein
LFAEKLGGQWGVSVSDAELYGDRSGPVMIAH